MGFCKEVALTTAPVFSNFSLQLWAFRINLLLLSHEGIQVSLVCTIHKLIQFGLFSRLNKSEILEAQVIININVLLDYWKFKILEMDIPGFSAAGQIYI